MPTRNSTRTKRNVEREMLYVWSGLLNGDDGAWLDVAGFAERTVQFDGTFGAGGTIILEGSLNGGTNAFTLSDTTSTALSATSARLRVVLENVSHIRPRVTAGDVATNLNCRLVVSR